MASLLPKLSLSLGPRQAAIEIEWMRQAACAPHDLQTMVNRRAHGEPLQYILGTQPFGPLNILTRRPTLIPRPETEQWTLDLANKIQSWDVLCDQRPLKLLDLCTGSGCIPLLLCHLLNTRGIQVAALGIDISQSACELARDNLASNSLSPGSSLIIQQKNIFDDDFWEFAQKAYQRSRLHQVFFTEQGLHFDIITANPPYIPKDQWQRLPREVKDWEDPVALLGDPLSHNGDRTTVSSQGNKGLTFYKRIRNLLLSPGVLSHPKVLAMEVGDGQAGDVVNLFGNGFGKTEAWKDWWGKERAVFIYGGE